MRRLLVVAFLLVFPSVAAAQPNLLVIVLDDVGVDITPAYGATGVSTPTIDHMARNGVRFENTWFRTGVGTWVHPTLSGHTEGLSVSETTIADVLRAEGYATGIFGKWHLTPFVDPDAPLEYGFDKFDGFSPSRFITSLSECGFWAYDNWTRSEDGAESCDNRYATKATTDDAIGWLTSQQGPWLLIESHIAIHNPFHCPPGKREKALWALEYADAEIRRLVVTARDASLSKGRSLWVILAGDNGTNPNVWPGTCSSGKAKGTVFEGGIKVPLIIWTPGGSAGIVSDPVGLVDLFATLAELGGATSTAEDSVSLVPYLSGDSGSVRSSIYSEKFLPNGLPFSPWSWDRVVRDVEGWKLMQREGKVDELFHLPSDPCEDQNRLPAPSGSEAEAAYLALLEELP
jgi:arylsulfatase A-like enzyme